MRKSSRQVVFIIINTSPPEDRVTEFSCLNQCKKSMIYIEDDSDEVYAFGLIMR